MKIELFLLMMLKWININSIVVTYLFLLGYTLQAQSQSEVELVMLLKSTEEVYDVTFNYLEEDVADVWVIPPKGESSLEDILDHLQQQIPFEFKFNSPSSISIRMLKDLSCIRFLNTNTNTAVSGVLVNFGSKSLGTSNTFGKLFIQSSINSNDLEVDHPRFYTTDPMMREDSGLCQTIYLFPEIELDEVWIREYLAKGISLNGDNSLTIVPEEFGVLPGLINADVLHSLQYVPGVVNTDETIAQINIRGGTHDQNLILWNGSRMYQTGHFFGMISAINPLINHEIKVIKNGGSAFYNEGVSSVIDISSRPHANDFSSKVELNFLAANATTHLEWKDKSSLQIAARKSLTEVWESPTYHGFTDKVFQNTEIQDLLDGSQNRITTQQELQFLDLALQYDYAISPKQHLEINLMGIHNQLRFDEVLELTGVQTQNDFKQTNGLAHISYQNRWSRRHTSSIAFNTSIYDREAFNRSVVSAQDLLQANEVVDYKLSLRDEYQLSKRFKLNFGYQFNEVGVVNNSEVSSPEVILREKRVLLTHSGISEMEFKSNNNKISLRAGLRGNYYSSFEDFRLEPRLNLNYQLNNVWSWNVLGEIKNQTITQVIDQQQDFLGIENRRWILANEDNFPIINSQQIEVGFNFSKKGWLLQASLYHKLVEGISSGSQGFQNQLEFLQINGDYEVIGLEFLAQKRWDDVNAWFNFSLMDNTYEFRTFVPQQFANNFEITQSSSFGVTYTSDQLQLTAGGRYFAGRPITDIDPDDPILTPDTNPRPNFLSPNQNNLQDYLQINFTGSYEFDLSQARLKLGCSVLNVFNSSNLTQQFFRIDNDNSSIENVRIKSLELTPNAFISIQF